MSVIMTAYVDGDPRRLEEYAAAHADDMARALGRAKEHGLIAHRFYGSEDGHILVADEWPDAESFRRFYEEMTPVIGPMFEAAGAASEPMITFWRKLDTRDDFGWET
jgi:hypothetical protein